MDAQYIRQATQGVPRGRGAMASTEHAGGRCGNTELEQQTGHVHERHRGFGQNATTGIGRSDQGARV